jgi:formate hydrogenlyase subunit 4
VESITLASLLTVTGVALFLSVIVLPLAKAAGASGNRTLVVSYVAGVLVPVIVSVLVGNTTPALLGQAALTGLMASAMANGLYRVKQAISGPDSQTK